MPLFRTVRSAITALGSRLRPTAEPGRADAGSGNLMDLPFTHRAAFSQQMNDQLDDSSHILDDMDAKLRSLRTHVVNLRNSWQPRRAPPRRPGTRSSPGSARSAVSSTRASAMPVRGPDPSRWPYESRHRPPTRRSGA